MAQIILTARRCTFENRGGVPSRQHRLLEQPLATETQTLKTCEEIREALKQFSARVGQQYPASYFCSVSLQRGERAPKGFRNQTFIAEVDRCTQAQAAG